MAVTLSVDSHVLMNFDSVAVSQFLKNLVKHPTGLVVERSTCRSETFTEQRQLWRGQTIVQSFAEQRALIVETIRVQTA